MSDNKNPQSDNKLTVNLKLIHAPEKNIHLIINRRITDGLEYQTKAETAAKTDAAIATDEKRSAIKILKNVAIVY